MKDLIEDYQTGEMVQKYSNKRVRDIVDFECLDIAVLHCIDEGSIEDPKLAEAWRDAKRALKFIVDYIGLDY